MSQYHVNYICYAILEISFHSLHLISLMGFIDLIKVLVKEDLYKALQWIIRLGLNEAEVCFDQLSNWRENFLSR